MDNMKVKWNLVFFKNNFYFLWIVVRSEAKSTSSHHKFSEKAEELYTFVENIYS